MKIKTDIISVRMSKEDIELIERTCSKINRKYGWFRMSRSSLIANIVASVCYSASIEDIILMYERYPLRKNSHYKAIVQVPER